jgi:hypothetical protein
MAMINITVLKYGTKYSSNYVNNFFKEFKTKTTFPCKFWVQTEDPTGLDDYIGIIPIVNLDPVGRRWHKLDLFETDLLTGKCFHFDLDMIINKNKTGFIYLNLRKHILNNMLYPNFYLSVIYYFKNKFQHLLNNKQ